MKYYLFFFLFFFLYCTTTTAANTTSYAGSSIKSTEHKHSKQYFLDNYGKDDSSRALINYFFKKRKDAFYESVISPVAGGASVLILNLFLKSMANVKEDTGGLGFSVAIPLILIIYAVPVYIIDGQIKWLIFNRRKLLTILESYNSGNSLPAKITRRKVFKLELEKLK